MLRLVIQMMTGNHQKLANEPWRNQLQRRPLRRRDAGGDGTDQGERLRLQAGCGRAMELLWAAAVLMLLGAAISLCVKCQLSATKREKQLSDQRSQLESQQRFEVIRSHSTVTRRLEQIKEPVNLSTARKTAEELGTYCHVGYGNRTECRYQNFLTEDCLRGDTGDAAYVEPIPLDYYNRARFLAPPRAEKEEDSHSYQNVIIGESHSSDPDDDGDYENSAAIHVWELQRAEALQKESSDDEPDYVNTIPALGPSLLSKKSILYRV
ncbi:linker for activation of T-cells family member 2 [Phaenicophaeus curvirostris]|uniref:linker for activation of T-cells family member 2 n=1 Tax=Phaenicophaeus curvirostris TaxID=33595 RepID=UPI0037F0A9A7